MSGIPGEYNYVMQNTAVTTVGEYQAARASLMNDLQTFDAAVARADEMEPVYYVPLQGYMTRTADDEVRAAWGQMAFNVSMAPNVYATLRSGKAFKGTVTAEPVVALSAGNVTAPIPIRIADQWRLPHGNRLDASGPHDVYAIVDVNTKQVYHFGETGRGWKTRGAEWRRKLAREYGLETEVVPLRTGIVGKAAAKELETRYITTYEKAFGQKPFYINGAGEVITIQKTKH